MFLELDNNSLHFLEATYPFVQEAFPSNTSEPFMKATRWYRYRVT